MRNAPTTWADYIAWAADQVSGGRRGGVAELARLSGLHRDTLFQWKAGRNADTPKLRHVRAIAEAVGDDPHNALRAAGLVRDDAGEPDDGPAGATAATPDGPTLAEQLRTIRESGLPLEQQIAAAAELVAMYRRPTPETAGAADPEAGHRTSA